MGATDFMVEASGKTLREAFHAAQKQARYDYGHAGYTGSIAEKDSAVVISATALSDNDAEELAEKLMEDDDQRISDKWGPAGAIRLTGDRWLLFGWASS